MKNSTQFFNYYEKLIILFFLYSAILSNFYILTNHKTILRHIIYSITNFEQ